MLTRRVLLEFRIYAALLRLQNRLNQLRSSSYDGREAGLQQGRRTFEAK